MATAPTISVPDGFTLAADLTEYAACECTDGTHGQEHRDPWRDFAAQAATDSRYLPGGHVITRMRVVMTGPVTEHEG